MNSAMTYNVSSSSSKNTQSLAAKLAKFLPGGLVLELASDLGGGKTTFTQGLAKGLGFTGAVTSPTFTLSQIYPLPDGRELHHYDLYRLGEAGVVGQELEEDMHDAQIITIIEWADIAHQALPEDRLMLTIEPTSEDGRQLSFTAGGPRAAEVLAKLKEAL